MKTEEYTEENLIKVKKILDTHKNYLKEKDLELRIGSFDLYHWAKRWIKGYNEHIKA